MSQSENPYAEEYNPFQAPQTPFEQGGVAGTEAEVIRRAHLSHEASVKSVGVLYLIGGVVCVIAVITIIFAAVVQPIGANGGTPGIIMVGMLSGIGIAQCFAAVGLRRLRRWARVVAGILAGIGLLGFPFGTIINGYILYLLFSAKGTMVFSDEYQQIIEQTPHIKYKTSIIVKIFVVLVILLVVFALLAPLFLG